MKSLIIVGSAPLEKNLSPFIDACDCVIRFNNCKNYGGNSGRKTDILFLSNSGDPANHPTLDFMLKERSPEEVETELPYLSRARHVWFVRPPSAELLDFLKNRIPDSVPLKKAELQNNSHQRELAAEIVRALKIPEEKVRHVSAEFHASVWDKLMRYGSTEAVLPSTGIVAIETILLGRQWEIYKKKYITGFGWTGWEGHPWGLEKQLAEDYLTLGKLLPSKRISRDPGLLFRKIFRTKSM
jgi:hypothetical protein